MDNPYQAPLASDVVPEQRRAAFTPLQISAGVFLGGPLAATHLLRANFITLGKHDEANITVIAGLGATVLLFVVAWMLPDGVPGFPLVIVQMVLARIIAEKLQIPQASFAPGGAYVRRSRWLVFGVAVGYLALTVALVFGAAMLID